MHKKLVNKEQRGATAVELALILPLLVLLVFAIIEFSLLLYNQAMITNASREGSRVGVVWGPDYGGQSYRISRNEIIDHVELWLGNNLISFSESNARITPENPDEVCSGEVIDKLLKVRVEYDYSFLFLPLATVTLSSEANMRCESTE